MRIFLLSLASLMFLGCAKDSGTSTGNPLVALKFDSFTSTLALKTGDVGTEAVSSLKLCFKRLRFKLANTTAEDEVDFYLGDVTISNLGTDLGSINLPIGTYDRVEFDLDEDCPSTKSIQLVNSSGSFSTTDRISIRFDGTFTHTGSSDVLGMSIQQIVDSLNTVTNSSQLKAKAEGASGSF
ncbi:hypothetical protein [Bdellovibrio sp. HCB2-146]|uniref:hypothetical protein n=1 Tax=Bdellovibrio sp. HCB2-146 TaxID=3394362 RepID=UPI0039BD6283